MQQPQTPPRLLAPSEALDFMDSQSVILPRALTAIEAWNLIMSHPLPGMGLAFRIRDAIAARFGVRRIGGFSGRAHQAPVVGERLNFFRVEEVSAQMLVLTDRDKHLDVMTCVQTSGARLTITSSVITHNRFGKLYMLPVAPAHRFIVRAMLRRAALAP